MIIINNSNFTLKNTAVTLGNFDGFHTGHRRLVSEVVDSGLPSVIFTFSPHPMSFFKPDNCFKTILTDEEKIATADLLGADYFINYPFTKDFAELSPKKFASLLYEKTGCSLIVIGENYTFGKNKSGNADILKKLFENSGTAVKIVPDIKYNEITVCSTAIRDYLKKGLIEEANKLLSYEFFISGKVINGRHIGFSLGFPTANINISENKLLPSDGVYATRVITGNKTYKAITNIGKNPTFENRQRTVETHIPGWKGDLYGKNITVCFRIKIRDEIRFSSKDELMLQIDKDIKKSEEIL